MALDVDAARPVRNNPHDIRRERRMMRAFQNPVLGPLLRRFGGPEDIVQMGMSFWSSRLILSAVEAGVFTELANGRQYEHELADALGWHPRAAGTALDALVAAGLLRRDRAGRYANTIRGATFLDRSKPSYVGGLMELSSRRLYGLWSELDDLLRTGRPGAEEERGDNEFFSMLYQDPLALRDFLAGMTGISTGEVTLLASRFPWKRFRTFVDIGCAQGALPVRVALTHRHLRGTGFDFPAVRPIFHEYVSSFGLEDRLNFVEGDFLEVPLPRADVISFGHVFHGRNQSIRQELVGQGVRGDASRRRRDRLRRDDSARPAKEPQQQLPEPAVQPQHHAGVARGLRILHQRMRGTAPRRRLHPGEGAPPGRSDVGGVRLQTRPAALDRRQPR